MSGADSKTFERMQDGEMPLTDLNTQSNGLTSSTVAAGRERDWSIQYDQYHAGLNESDDNISAERVEQEPDSTIFVTTQWKVSS
jgi:hypothetical protein